jgi:hypothetical protein
MAAGAQKLYPRATLKKIVKAHSKKNVTKNVDVLVSLLISCSREAVTFRHPQTHTIHQIFLDYALFLQR